VCDLDFRLQVWNGSDVGKIGVTSEFGWEESFDPELARFKGIVYFASIAASTKVYWSSNAGALIVEITASAPLKALTNEALSL
jgi:hypothetical protein